MTTNSQQRVKFIATTTNEISPCKPIKFETNQSVKRHVFDIYSGSTPTLPDQRCPSQVPNTQSPYVVIPKDSALSGCIRCWGGRGLGRVADNADPTAVRHRHLLGLPVDHLDEKSKKVVPKIPGTTTLCTTVTCILPLQLPSWSDHTPCPQRRTLRPKQSRMEPLTAPKTSPLVALSQVDSGTTETTAPLSKRKEISSLFALPVTDGDCPAWSSFIARRRRSLVPLL
ncbi:hypothetical protein T09_9401 [Trichinella sp. T9]|nr:hypothetical protein T09_9401 [Trichinella sp. T9]